jgi:hypothetical protein
MSNDTHKRDESYVRILNLVIPFKLKKKYIAINYLTNYFFLKVQYG